MKTGKLPWTSGVVRSARPGNYATGRFYTGMNWIILAAREDRDTPLWMTFKQAMAAGFRVRAGEKGETIFLYAPSYFDPKTNEKISDERYKELSYTERLALKMIPFMRYATVFNLDQLEGADEVIESYRKAPPAVVRSCESIADGWRDCPEVMVNSVSDRGYMPELDVITMPHRWQYDDQSRYYKTLFHEMIHATGHAKRLNRFSLVDYENNRPFEEMVAEIGAAFLCNITGIVNEGLLQNTTAYIQHWIRGMENDEKYIFRAASMAQKAVDYILANSTLPESQALSIDALTR